MSDAKPPTPEDATSSSSQQLLKLLVELGPLIVFFMVNWRAGIFWGTGAFMVATLASLAASRALFGRVPLMPLVSGVFVIVFGALTLWLQDEIFIKMKPTIVNTLFGIILLGGLIYGISLLKYLFADAFMLDEDGWKKLTWRWTFFFFFLALLNEFIWRTFSTDFWIAFKIWGVMPLTIAFGLLQLGLIKRHSLN